MLLAIDPSVSSPGVALFRSGELLACDRLKVVAGGAGAPGWLHVAREIAAYAIRRGVYNTVVFERPQIYRAVKSKGNPNDLIGLAGVGMAVVGLLADTLVDVLSPTPAEWIGQLPKSTTGSAKTSPRAKFILSRLAPGELELVPDQHDAIDAVGVGLWALGRLKPTRVLSNGR